VEFGGHGSSVAAPIAKEVLKRYVLLERGGEEQLAYAPGGKP
jgi:hypothetical protein